MKYLVGIDNGGTFSKAAIFDEEGNQISVASVPTETLTPKPGYTEKDLNELWEVNAQAVRQAEKSGIDPSDIAGVSFPAQEKDFIWSAMMENRLTTVSCPRIQGHGNRWNNGIRMELIKKFTKKHFRKFLQFSR